MPVMTGPSNPRRPKRGTWTPQPETLALLRCSGNKINGVGETTPRQPSPFFWHSPDQHPWDGLQLLARGVERWYVNFDKCIPYFAEAASCGICIAECPWTRPSVRPKLLATMAQRIGKE